MRKMPANREGIGNSRVRKTDEPTRVHSEYSRIAGLVGAGEWTSYGDIAIVVHGTVRLARRVGRAASISDDFANAHRILRTDGSVARPPGAENSARRAIKALRREGVNLTRGKADPARRIHWDELLRRAGGTPRLQGQGGLERQ
jgi:alkylated DNA nucleotide flippase Atl1